MAARSRKYNIIFVGLDYKVLELLLKSKQNQVVAVNLITDFFDYKTINISNLFFKTIYYFRCLERFYWLEFILLRFYKVLSCIGSELFKKYSSYLHNLSHYKIKVIDFKNIKEVINFIETQKVDLIVVSNWWLLPDKIISSPLFKTVNIHPSNLPMYRGAVPTLWSLKNKDKKTAVSFMVINSSMDGGDVFAQHKVEIEPTDDSLTLEHKCDTVIKKHFNSDLLKYLKGQTIPKKQRKELLSFTAKYYEYMKIDWTHELGRDIVNKIILYPHLWPIDKCYTIYQRKKISFKRAKLSSGKEDGAPGSFSIKKLNVYAYCADSVVVFRLFRDINLRDSFTLFFKRKGVFGG